MIRTKWARSTTPWQKLRTMYLKTALSRDFFLSSPSPRLMLILRAIYAILVLFVAKRSDGGRIWHSFQHYGTSCRNHHASVTEFGAVGDGRTLNTEAFRAAVESLSRFSSTGGSLLFIPPGKWLTGSFNLTSHFTLYLHRDAVLLASQDISTWPTTDPLPSYGRGRDAPGNRYRSFIFGTNVTDVIVTGDNGTIDGQGDLWWKAFKEGQLNLTRPYLLEIMYSTDIQISRLTFVNSPSWNIHPVYSSNIIVQGITILAPATSPNTDGINPDSCTSTRIEDCFIVSGDDCIAVKSGWDEYGIAFAMPTRHLVVRRLTCISPTSAVIALGSELSGGIQDVRAEDILALNSESGVRIKTAVGRGAYVKDVFVRGMRMQSMKYVFWMTGNYGSHPDNKFHPTAFTAVDGINYRDMVADDVIMAGRLEGIPNDPFTGICISNVTITMGEKAKKLPWNCSDVQGISHGVQPLPCPLLPEQERFPACPFPTDSLPIEDVELQLCSSKLKY